MEAPTRQAVTVEEQILERIRAADGAGLDLADLLTSFVDQEFSESELKASIWYLIGQQAIELSADRRLRMRHSERVKAANA